MFSSAANFLQICANLQKFWNNMMSNDGLIIENMDLSHIHLAVLRFTVHFRLCYRICYTSEVILTMVTTIIMVVVVMVMMVVMVLTTISGSAYQYTSGGHHRPWWAWHRYMVSVLIHSKKCPTQKSGIHGWAPAGSRGLVNSISYLKSTRA